MESYCFTASVKASISMFTISLQRVLIRLAPFSMQRLGWEHAGRWYCPRNGGWWRPWGCGAQHCTSPGWTPEQKLQSARRSGLPYPCLSAEQKNEQHWPGTWWHCCLTPHPRSSLDKISCFCLKELSHCLIVFSSNGGPSEVSVDVYCLLQAASWNLGIQLNICKRLSQNLFTSFRGVLCI